MKTTEETEQGKVIRREEWRPMDESPKEGKGGMTRSIGGVKEERTKNRGVSQEL